MTAPSGPQRDATSRRRFLAAAGTAAAVPAAAALIGGGPLGGTARAAAPGGPTSYAPIPPGALGPALNADGYFVGNINGNLYWVTDSVYLAMFLTTRNGAVLVDAPPTIGHNLLRAISAVTPGERQACGYHPPGVLALTRRPHRGFVPAGRRRGAHRPQRMPPPAAAR